MKSNLEDILAKYISNSEQGLQNQEALLTNLDVLLRQLANIVSIKVQGTLLSYVEKNRKDQVKAVTSKNGRELQKVPGKKDAWEREED